MNSSEKGMELHISRGRQFDTKDTKTNSSLNFHPYLSGFEDIGGRTISARDSNLRIASKGTLSTSNGSCLRYVDI